MNRLALSAEERSALDAGVSARIVALLKLAEGQSVAAVARLVGVSRVTLYHWVNAYNRARDPADLIDRRAGRPATGWTGDLESILISALLRAPRDWNFRARNWTVPLLQQHLARLSGQLIPEAAIRRQLREL